MESRLGRALAPGNPGRPRRSRKQLRPHIPRQRGNKVYVTGIQWLERHYQYANRLAALHFLNTQGIKAHLVMVYFMGDRHSSASTTCPASEQEWESAIQAAEKHLGLTGKSELETRVHKVFLPVCPDGATHPLLRAPTYGPGALKQGSGGGRFPRTV